LKEQERQKPAPSQVHAKDKDDHVFLDLSSHVCNLSTASPPSVSVEASCSGTGRLKAKVQDRYRLLRQAIEQHTKFSCAGGGGQWEQVLQDSEQRGCLDGEGAVPGHVHRALGIPGRRRTRPRRQAGQSVPALSCGGGRPARSRGDREMETGMSARHGAVEIGARRTGRP
jgi:hypothetical protein